MTDSQVKNWPEHFERLRKGAEFLYGPFPEEDWGLKLKHRLELQLEQEKGDRILRLALYLDQEQRSLALSPQHISSLKIHLKSEPLMPESGLPSLKLRSCAAPVRPNWWPAYLKCGQYLESILARKIFLKPGDDDLLFLAHDDVVSETTVANVFVVKNNILYTSPIGPQVLEGVMRSKILEIGANYFSGVQETASSYEQLLRADVVFVTNSVHGLQLVKSFDDHDLKISDEWIATLSRLREKVLA